MNKLISLFFLIYFYPYKKNHSIMSEENIFAEDPSAPVAIKPARKARPEVIIVRDWKEYLGESFLIIFSVLLALILTELITSWNESKEAKEYIKNIIEELKINKERQQQQ